MAGVPMPEISLGSLAPAIVHRAVHTVCGNATDAQDARLILQALGLSGDLA